MADQPFSVYYALDGPDLDGLVGSAGILRFDWPERKFYIQHFDGISSGHNPSLAPNGKLALLGNFSQTIHAVGHREWKQHPRSRAPVDDVL